MGQIQATAEPSTDDSCNLAKCGAVNPYNKNVKCVRVGGPCLTDDHIGIEESRNGEQRFVVWGKSARGETWV